MFLADSLRTEISISQPKDLDKLPLLQKTKESLIEIYGDVL